MIQEKTNKTLDAPFKFQQNNPTNFLKWKVNILKDINISRVLGFDSGTLAPKWMRKYYS